MRNKLVGSRHREGEPVRFGLIVNWLHDFLNTN